MFKRGIETISDLGIGRLSCLKKSQILNRGPGNYLQSQLLNKSFENKN